MKRSRFGKTALVAAAICLTASLSVGSALAYFTTYVTAQGSVPMDMGFTDTDIKEKVDKDGKHVTIKNTGQYDCFVRVKVFAPENIPLTYTAGEGWSQKSIDGYWYYDFVLTPGEMTSELLVSYELPEAPDSEGEADTRPDEINIVVVHEYVPVLYDEVGKADLGLSWSNVASVVSTDTGTEQEGE